MRVFISIVIGVMFMWGFFSCATRRSYNAPASYSTPRANTTKKSNTTVVVDSEAKSGLDLEAVTALVEKVENAEQLEKKLNEENGINNLDLNEDDKVDYISVTEFGDKNSYGFSLTVEPAEGEEQEIATIEVTKENEKAQVHVSGNQRVYGQGHHYNSSHLIGGLLLYSYLTRPHPYYHSPWGWGRYPGYYGSGYRTVGYSSYHSRTRSYVSTSSVTRSKTSTSRSKLTSPNKNKVANKGIKKSLSNPTKSQKSFQARNPSKAVKSGGFGRANRSSSSKSTSRNTSTPRTSTPRSISPCTSRSTPSTSRKSTSSSRGSSSRSTSRGFGGRGK